MTPADLIVTLKACDPAAFGDLSLVALGRALSKFGAGARAYGRERGVYYSDLLAAAANYRPRSSGEPSDRNAG